jgi:hypothetical protein
MSRELESLAYHLFSHVAHRHSARSLAKLGVVTSPVTATKYLRFIEEAFLVFRYRVRAALSEDRVEHAGGIAGTHAVDDVCGNRVDPRLGVATLGRGFAKA